jgi:hypothetical protein
MNHHSVKRRDDDATVPSITARIAVHFGKVSVHRRGQFIQSTNKPSVVCFARLLRIVRPGFAKIRRALGSVHRNNRECEFAKVSRLDGTLVKDSHQSDSLVADPLDLGLALGTSNKRGDADCEKYRGENCGFPHGDGLDAPTLKVIRCHFF